jgi:hypothetical protein
MLVVPSVEQGTLARRGNELAEFVRRDSGLVIRSAVPTSYAAVVQALGTGQADIAWVPAFAYVVAHARYGAEARLQVVREAERFAVVVTRSGAGEPAGLADLAKKRIAIPKSFSPELRATLTPELNRWAPGWVEVPATDDKDAVQQLLDRADAVDAAASSWVRVRRTSSATAESSSSTTVPGRSRRPESPSRPPRRLASGSTSTTAPS